MNFLLVGLVLIPVLVGVVLAVLPRRLSERTAYALALAGASVAGICATALLAWTGREPTVAVEWLPGTGAMGVDLSATGVYAALVTTWAAVLALIGGARIVRSWPSRSMAAILIALAASNATLVADHFLLRYAALEIVALAIALAPLIERGGQKGGASARTAYIVLRIGDAALLSAIALLAAAAGTLEIVPALRVGQTLEGAQAGWVAAGLILAVWIKLGGWPFYLWMQAGQPLALPTRAWLYATVMPNLGLYLLFKVTPLLSRPGPAALACAWIGAAAAVLGAFFSLTRRAWRASLSCASVAIGMLAFVSSAAGVGVAAWLTLLIVTPVRVLLHLSADHDSTAGIGAWFSALGGGIGAAWGGVCMYWARSAGTPPAVLLLAELSVALLGVWVAKRAWYALRAARDAGGRAWAGAAALAAGTAGVVLGFGPLLSHLIEVGHAPLPAWPHLGALAHYAVSTPSTWIGLAIGGGLWLWRRQPVARAAQPSSKVAQGFSRVARAVRDVVDSGLQEQIVATIARGAALIHREIERRLLGGMLRGIARAADVAAQFAHRSIEQQSLEGVLARLVQAALGFARALQGLHTGKLRRNLLWAAGSLILAIGMVWFGW